MISVFFFYFISDSVPHSGNAPTMKILDPFMIFKWENLQNHWVIKYLTSLCIYIHGLGILVFMIILTRYWTKTHKHIHTCASIVVNYIVVMYSPVPYYNTLN